MKATSHVQPFGFERYFSAHEGGCVAESGNLSQQVTLLQGEIMHLKAEIASREAMARQQGFEAGLTQARGEQQQALLHAADALNACLENVDQVIDEERRRMVADAAELAMAIADHLAAIAIARDPLRPVSDLVARVFEEVSGQHTLTIRVASDQAASLKELLTTSMARWDRRLVVMADDQLRSGDARIEWSGGEAVLDADGRRKAILSAIEEALR